MRMRVVFLTVGKNIGYDHVPRVLILALQLPGYTLQFKVKTLQYSPISNACKHIVIVLATAAEMSMLVQLKHPRIVYGINLFRISPDILNE
jgi:hypothetical protein